jgi:hypothetical protein
MHDVLAALDKAIDYALTGKMAVREASKWLGDSTGQPLSHTALKRHIDKKATGRHELIPAPRAEKAPDWELHPEKYKQNEDGSFVMNRAGRPCRLPPKKADGSPKYHYSGLTKAKMRARGDIREKEKRAQQLERKLMAARASVKAKKEIAAKLDASLAGKPNVATIVSESDLGPLEKSVREEILSNDDAVAFRPNPGPQTDFLAADEKDVLYGGAAGGKDQSFYRLLSAQAVKIKFVNCWKLLTPHVTTT